MAGGGDDEDDALARLDRPETMDDGQSLQGPARQRLAPRRGAISASAMPG